MSCADDCKYGYADTNKIECDDACNDGENRRKREEMYLLDQYDRMLVLC